MGNLCVKKKDTPHSVPLPNNLNPEIPVDSSMSFGSDKDEPKCQLPDRNFSKAPNTSLIPPFSQDGIRQTNNCKFKFFLQDLITYGMLIYCINVLYFH